MSEPIRCPMCGKQNPADLEVCQFCQARLKPLVAHPPEDQNAPAEPSAELPDWLRSLRQTGPLGVEDDSGEGAGAETGESAAEDAEPPDWLSSLRPSGSDEEELTEEETLWSPAEQPGTTPDWRASLGFDEQDSEEEESSGTGPALPAEEEPEWLQRIRSRYQEDAAGQELPQFPIDEPEDAGWGASAYSIPDEGGEPAQDGLPGWLAGTNTPPSTEQPGTRDLWAGTEAQPNQETDLPDWLKGFSSPESEERSTPASQTGAGLPSEQSIPQAELQPESEPGLPDWLKGFSSAAPEAGEAAAEEQPEESQPAFQSEPDMEVPDWLSAFTPAAPSEGEEQPIPEWLSQAGADFTGAEAFGPDEADALAQEAEVPQAEAGEPDATAPEAVGADESGAIAFEENPAPLETNWLDEIGAVAFDSAEEKEELPAAFSGVAPFALDAEGKAQLDPLYEEGLPDWLVQAALQDSQGETQTPPPAEENGGELAHAELPTWLEAMRPVEAQAISPDNEATVGTAERAGPLAGLRGVLPAEADISQARKPPAYSVKLQVSDVNQEHADLLSRIIQAEGEARALPGRPVVSSQYLLRLAIFLALLVVTGLVVFAPGLVQWLPVSSPALSPEVVATSRLVTGLQPGEPVLVAFDYQPAYSGELDAAAGAVVDHLMVKGAFLTLVSTTPTGPVQAERLLGSVMQRTGHTYVPSQQYTNLGFIPGGAAGLLSFAQNPKQAVPFSLNGTSAWEAGPLQPVAALSDFAMVFVVTENPETARNWIEQVQPALGTAPLIMVVSAQAEPMVRPYFDASPQQVQGMVTGLSGGAAYERLTGRQGPASAYWAPFSFGALLAAAIILIGGLANAISGMNARRKQAAEGGSQP